PPIGAALAKHWDIRERQICLVPAPLYHTAPWAAAAYTLFFNGTVVVMERFDPEEALKAIETHRVSYAQFVPTMFSRMLKLPSEVRTVLRPLLAPIRSAWSRSLPRAG